MFVESSSQLSTVYFTLVHNGRSVWVLWTTGHGGPVTLPSSIVSTEQLVKMKSLLNGETSTGFNDFVQDLYTSESFEGAFDTFEKRVQHLGYESTLYTYIPKVLIETDFVVKPVYKVSEDYCPGFIKHYEDARFDKTDPLIRAVVAGVDKPIDWWGDVCKAFTHGESASHEVIETSRQYGIKSGVTIPLMSGKSGIAGASFINTEAGRMHGVTNPHVEELMMSTQLFHGFVQSNACYKGAFVKTLLDAMSQTEKRFLAGLARGQAPSEIAYDLNTTERYLEQVMLKIRRKFSGVGPTETPKINRNQLLYYAGLMDILEHVA